MSIPRQHKIVSILHIFVVVRYAASFIAFGMHGCAGLQQSHSQGQGPGQGQEQSGNNEPERFSSAYEGVHYDDDAAAADSANFMYNNFRSACAHIHCN